jgi:hypothetical protein
MSSVLNFLQQECIGIKAFVDEFGAFEASIDEENMNRNIANRVSQYPELTEYFAKDSACDNDGGCCMNEPKMSQKEANKNASWTPSLRLAIIDHLMSFDIDLHLLIHFVKSYRFVGVIEEFVEIVRALDILGAETRLAEYEAVLVLKLKEAEDDEREWERRYGDRLPVSFFDHLKSIRYLETSQLLGSVGSQRLIEYYLMKISKTYQLDLFKQGIFLGLCRFGHLSMAQWLYYQDRNNFYFHRDVAFFYACTDGHLSVAQWIYSLGDLNIDTVNEKSFPMACESGHLSIVQWIYSLGGVVFDELNIHALFDRVCQRGQLSVAQWLHDRSGLDIHVENDRAFRLICENGHLSIAQWLVSLGGVNIHANKDESFGGACEHGHLIVAQWLLQFGEVDIHASDDRAFRRACENGHLSVAQWLYSLGGMNIHSLSEYAFRLSCEGGHLSVAQWLFSLGGVDIHAFNDCAFKMACKFGRLSVVQWLYSLGGISTDALSLSTESVRDEQVRYWLQSIS